MTLTPASSATHVAQMSRSSALPPFRTSPTPTQGVTPQRSETAASTRLHRRASTRPVTALPTFPFAGGQRSASAVFEASVSCQSPSYVAAKSAPNRHWLHVGLHERAWRHGHLQPAVLGPAGRSPPSSRNVARHPVRSRPRSRSRPAKRSPSRPRCDVTCRRTGRDSLAEHRCQRRSQRPRSVPKRCGQAASTASCRLPSASATCCMRCNPPAHKEPLLQGVTVAAGHVLTVR